MENNNVHQFLKYSIKLKNKEKNLVIAIIIIFNIILSLNLTIKYYSINI